MPFEVPSSWVWTTLGEISNYGDSKNVQVENIGLTDWILELEDIEKDSGSVVQCVTKSERKINGTRHKFSTGEILYSKLRTYLNKVLIAPSDGYCTTEIMSFGTFGVLSNEYICHVLRSPYFLDYTIQCGYGVKMPRLSTTDACSGMIPLPPCAEQYRIVAEIERWFALIDQIEQGKVDLQTIIKQAKSKILDLAIHGKLVPQDPNDEPASELLKRINPKAEITCDNGQYAKIPKGWSLCQLGDIGEIITGNTPTKDIAEYYGGSIPFYKPTDLDKGKCVKNASENLSILGFEQARKLPINSILVTCIGATIGKTGLITAEGSCNQQINAIIPNNAAFAEFVYYVCISDYLQEEIKQNASATTLPILNKKNFAKLLFPLPPLPEQHRIVAKIEELFSKLDQIEKSLEA